MGNVMWLNSSEPVGGLGLFEYAIWKWLWTRRVVSAFHKVAESPILSSQRQHNVIFIGSRGYLLLIHEGWDGDRHGSPLLVRNIPGTPFHTSPVCSCEGGT